MALVAVFGVALLIAVLLSGLAARVVLSTSLPFLVGGALVGDGFLVLIHITGAVLVSVSPEVKEAFEPLGEALSEPAKFAAPLVFGALLTPGLFGDLPWQGYVAVALAIVLIRPASLPISLTGTRFGWREKLTAPGPGPRASPRWCTGCCCSSPASRTPRRRTR